MTVLGDILSSEIVDVGDVAGVTHSSVQCHSLAKPQSRSAPRDARAPAGAEGSPRPCSTVLGDNSARLWLRSPVPALDYEKPLDLVPAGRWREVADVLAAFADGVTA